MDITNHIYIAKLNGSYVDNEFNDILNKIKLYCNMSHLSYESDCEEWAVLSDKQDRICMVHDKLKLIFSNIKDFPEFVDMTVLYFEGYSDKIWSIDKNALEKLRPEFNWDTDIIDYNSFSTQDLYYATH